LLKHSPKSTHDIENSVVNHMPAISNKITLEAAQLHLESLCSSAHSTQEMIKSALKLLCDFTESESGCVWLVHNANVIGLLDCEPNSQILNELVRPSETLCEQIIHSVFRKRSLSRIVEAHSVAAYLSVDSTLHQQAKCEVIAVPVITETNDHCVFAFIRQTNCAQSFAELQSELERLAATFSSHSNRQKATCNVSLQKFERIPPRTIKNKQKSQDAYPGKSSISGVHVNDTPEETVMLVDDSLTADTPSNQFERASQILDSSKILSFAKTVVTDIRESATAFNIVNELRAYLGTGRICYLSIAKSCAKLRAISSVDSFDSRSELVVSIESLVEGLLKQKRTVWLPAEHEQLSQSQSKQAEKYFELASTRFCAVVPVFSSHADTEDPNEIATLVNLKPYREDIVAVVTIENLIGELTETEVRNKLDLVEPYIEIAVNNAVQYSRNLVLPAWNTIRRFLPLAKSRKSLKYWYGLLCFLLCMCGLSFIPSTHKLRVEGVIEPSSRSKVYASIAGKVEKLFVKEGLSVKEGDILLQLSNPDVELEYERIRGEYVEAQQTYMALRDQLNIDHRLDEPSQRSIRNDRNSTEERLHSLTDQLRIVAAKKAQLVIRSPQSGRVIASNLDRQLLDRPVDTGTYLLTVAIDDGPWDVELKLPDRFAGHLQHAQPNAVVTTVLKSYPDAELTARLTSIAPIACQDALHGSFIRTYATVDAVNSLPHGSIKPGTEAIAHIEIGQRSLGYCLLFEFFDWVNRATFRYGF
jgi:hypothetical protein